MKNRTEDLPELAKVFEEYGKKDIRLGQSIYNVIQKNSISLFNIENDKLLELLKEGLKE